MDWSSYDGIARDYATVAEEVYFAAPAADLIAALQVHERGKLLDVGTGTGAVMRVADGAGWKAVGCDVSLGMLLVGKRRRLVAGALPELPFCSHSFDAVTLAFVLNHVADVVAALHEIKRVLALGGLVAASSWGESPGSSAPGRVWWSVAEGFGSSDVSAALPSEARLSTREGWLEALHQAGFVNVHVDQKTYRIDIATDTFLRSRLLSLSARYLEAHLSADAWRRFVADCRQAVEREFGERLQFDTSVNFAIAR